MNILGILYSKADQIMAWHVSIQKINTNIILIPIYGDWDPRYDTI